MKYSKKELLQKYNQTLKFCALVNATILVSGTVALPAFAETIDARQQIFENTSYTDLSATGIHSEISNNGGVFYLEDVQDVTLSFEGETSFYNNSIAGGMGGAIGNGWLSTKDSQIWYPYTPGGKIVFNGPVVFEANTTNNSNGGGAIFNYGIGTTESPDIIFNNTTTFNGNTITTSSDSVYVGGAALNHTGGTIIFNDGATFSGNQSASKGGAVMSAGNTIFKGKTTFSNNSATIQGGALAIIGGNVFFEKEAAFSENTAGAGAAISMTQDNSSLRFQDSAIFQNNTGTATLWNNNTSGQVFFENGASFENNTNTVNGTLQNTGSVHLSGGNFYFLNNTGSNGGGLKNSGTVNVLTSGDILFEANTTTSSAGAFDNGGTTTMTANKICFNNNTADTGYGGAIFNAADLTLAGQENIFTGNEANDPKVVKSGGGAVHNRGNIGTTTLIIGFDNSANTFSGNISKAHGGAIVARAVDGAGQDSEVAINGTTTFSNNSAQANGGAIWNYVAEKSGTTGTANFVFNGDVSFVSNSANGLGGAIYNNGTMTFNGKSLFGGNMASNIANDIHNEGTINFNGDVTLDGGIENSGLIAFQNGIDLTVKLNSEKIISGTSGVLEGTPELILCNAADGSSIVLEGTKDNFDFAKNALYNIELADDGNTYNISKKNTGEVIDELAKQGVPAQVAQTISAIADSDTEMPVLSAITEAVQKGDTAVATEAAKELAPTTTQQVMGVVQNVNDLLSSATGNRMAIIGRSGGDAFAGGSTWAQGLYNHTKQSKSAKTDGFRAHSQGVALGIDGKVNEEITIGAGYGYTYTKAKDDNHNVNIKGNNIFAYAQYQPNAWFINGMFNYGLARYTEKKAPMSVVMKAKYDVNSYAVNMTTGYDFKSGFTPEIGMRYLFVDQKSYNDGAQRIKADNSDVLTGVLGIKYTANLKAQDWEFEPTLRLATTYDILSEDHKTNVNIIGGGNYQISGKRLRRFGVETGLGVVASYGNWDFSADYNGGFRKDFQSYTGMLKAKYNF